MLKKLEIPPGAGGLSGCNVSLPSQEKNVRSQTIPRGSKADATAIGAAQMLWTAEAVEDLKRLALAGKSASHIAAALGVGSRNAVIGKASRIGIKLSGGGGRAAASGVAPSRAGRSQWATAHYARDNADASAARDPRGVSGSQPAEKRGAAWTLGEAEVGEMRRLRFEDIRESVCRWPLGDPRSGDFAYCGLTPVEGQSYCAGHCRMAYRPPQARRSTTERQGLRAIGNSWRVA
jgi:GcrA cell cycle regulator